uniref:Uncharacterized protein n=1 Tax=Anguilla anguilla TaxID=7936 RepID=A0A0E9TBN6_ANGAN
MQSIYHFYHSLKLLS